MSDCGLHMDNEANLITVLFAGRFALGSLQSIVSYSRGCAPHYLEYVRLTAVTACRYFFLVLSAIQLTV